MCMYVCVCERELAYCYHVISLERFFHLSYKTLIDYYFAEK